MVLCLFIEEADVLEEFYCPQYFLSCKLIIIKPHIHPCESMIDFTSFRITKHLAKFEPFTI